MDRMSSYWSKHPCGLFADRAALRPLFPIYTWREGAATSPRSLLTIFSRPFLRPAPTDVQYMQQLAFSNREAPNSPKNTRTDSQPAVPLHQDEDVSLLGPHRVSHSSTVSGTVLSLLHPKALKAE